MNRIVAKLREEPVRTILYPLIVILLGIAVTRGFITSDTADLFTTIVATILGVTGVEVARSKVSPVR